MKTFLGYSLSTFVSAITIYAFQILAAFIDTLISKSYERTTLFYVLVFVFIFAFGFMEFALLHFTKVEECNIDMKKDKTHPLKRAVVVMVASLISMLMGLAIGSEGPSSYVAGALFSFFFSSIFFKDDEKKRISSLSIGLGVGFGMVFQNPLAGILFSLSGKKIKELEKNDILWSLYSNVLGYGLFALLKFIYFPTGGRNAESILLYKGYSGSNYFYLTGAGYWVLALVPGFCIVCALIYIILLSFMRRLMSNNKFWSYALSLILATLISGLIFIYYGTDASGSGINIITRDSTKFTINWVFTLLGLRLALSLISFDGHFLGGMTVPNLAMGALVGQALMQIINWSDSSYFTYNDMRIIIIISMLTFYAIVSGKVIVAFSLAFSFLPFNIVVLPAMISLVPTYLLIRFSKYEGIASIFGKIDEDSVKGKINFKNFIGI